MPRPGIRLGPGAEFDLLRALFQRAPEVDRPEVALGPGDDAALLAAGDDYWALTADLCVEGVHFRLDWITAAEAAGRAVRAALSDLSAVAARPVGVLVSAAFPRSTGPADAEAVLRAAAETAADWGAALLGGDVARGGSLAFDVVALGRTGHPVLRSGARPGDELWVTGDLGAAAAAVRAWSAGGEPTGPARARFAAPTPRLAEAAWLAERGLVSAMIDVSDGLVADAGHLAAAGGVGIEIEAGAVPRGPGAEATDALAGGEDYELLFCARPGLVEPARASFESELGTPLHRVGRAVSGAAVRVFAEDGRPMALDAAGHDHFRAP